MDDMQKIESRPVIDTRRMGRVWDRQRDDSLIVAADCVSAIGKIKNGESVDDLNEIQAKLEAAIAKHEALIAEVLVEVPQDWLIPSAPPTADIDWSDPANFDYMQAAAFSALVQLVATACQDAAKNFLAGIGLPT